MSIETEVLAAMQAHVAARMSNDTDAVLKSYSDEWADSKGYTKQTLNDWHLASVIGSAKLEITIDLRTIEVVVDGSKAIISPILTDSAKGRISHKHHLKKESDGVWRLTYTETVDWELRSMDEDMQTLKDAIDATAMVVREHREQLLNDRWRPGYHFVVPEGVAAPFDPNGAIYWKGRYHLFYIFQDKRSGKKADHWGHISSTDLPQLHQPGLLLRKGWFEEACQEVALQQGLPRSVPCQWRHGAVGPLLECTVSNRQQQQQRNVVTFSHADMHM